LRNKKAETASYCFLFIYVILYRTINKHRALIAVIKQIATLTHQSLLTIKVKRFEPKNTALCLQ
ncbi:hypothetical protein VST04_27960, partial [Bacillus paranthracis]